MKHLCLVLVFFGNSITHGQALFDQTPYETLKRLYDQAEAAQITDLATYFDFKIGRPVRRSLLSPVKAGSSVEQLQKMRHFIWLLVERKNPGESSAASTGGGPLFPTTSSTSPSKLVLALCEASECEKTYQRIQTVNEGLLVNEYLQFTQTSSELKMETKTWKNQKEVHTLRRNKDYLLIKVSYLDDHGNEIFDAYSYAWKF